MIAIDGCEQVILADAEAVPALLVVTVAELLYVEHSVADVLAVMCTLKLPPVPSVVLEPPHESVCGDPVETEQRPAFD